MSIFQQIVLRIVKEQELIIGPVAWEQAGKVPGLKIVNTKSGEVEINGEEKAVLTGLVAQYEKLFGRASVEVCKDAVTDLVHQVSADKLPESLRV